MTFFSIRIALPLLLAAIVLFNGCREDPVCSDCPTEEPLIQGDYDPVAYDLQVPEDFPEPVIPEDNPMTVAGVELGRRLFYDPILSVDSTLACAGCHLPQLAFTDGLDKSVGVLGIETRRSSMSLVNVAFLNNGLFWDGSVATLEEQALLPIEAHDEMNDTWENVETKLRRHPDYPTRFRAAFGIEHPSELTRELVAKALAQFERTLISADSKYDRVVWQQTEEFTESEQRGFELFLIETAITFQHPGCTHCHVGIQLTDDMYHNNGITEVSSYEDFPDPGRGGVNGNIFDTGHFRTPTLRNIALTAPYMHDGRFATLEEVLDHYASGGHSPEFSNVNIRPFDLSEQEKADLIAFLHTLTDTTFLNNPAYQSPF
jgi:cytochrome c peroxidase